MSNISTERPSSITEFDKKEAITFFNRFDKEGEGKISRTHCIQALQLFLGREISAKELSEVNLKGKSMLIEKAQYLSLVKQISHLKQPVRECNTKLGEQYLIDNFSKREIKMLVNEWQKVDEFLQGYLSMQFTRIVIENVLQNYIDSNANDSEIKQFFIQKAHCDSIYFEEYMNFISSFIKSKKYKFSSKRGNNACACTIF